MRRVGAPVELTLEDVKALPRASMTTELRCIEGWSVVVNWAGARFSGRPLSIEPGAPLRLVAPVKYGIKSIERVGGVTFTDQRPPDFSAERGYDWYAGL